MSTICPSRLFCAVNHAGCCARRSHLQCRLSQAAWAVGHWRQAAECCNRRSSSVRQGSLEEYLSLCRLAPRPIHPRSLYHSDSAS
jgi:hypothetical protein